MLHIKPARPVMSDVNWCKTTNVLYHLQRINHWYGLHGWQSTRQGNMAYMTWMAPDMNTEHVARWVESILVGIKGESHHKEDHKPVGPDHHTHLEDTERQGSYIYNI